MAMLASTQIWINKSGAGNRPVFLTADECEKGYKMKTCVNGLTIEEQSEIDRLAAECIKCTKHILKWERRIIRAELSERRVRQKASQRIALYRSHSQCHCVCGCQCQP